jgi:hypothetical protein
MVASMGVTSPHPDFDANLPEWLRARDVLAGEDAIKTASEKYLPRLESQTGYDKTGRGPICSANFTLLGVFQGKGPKPVTMQFTQ